MDEDLFSSPSRPSRPGGAVEPAGRTVKDGPPAQGAAERYELRDRTADVIHRADTFSEMAAKAEALGITLFVAVAADGKRTSIQKVDGEWHRGPQRPASTATPVEPGRPVAPVDPVGAASGRQQVPEGGGVQPPPPIPTMSASIDPVDASTESRQEAKAERALLAARLEAALAERYIIRPAPVTVGDLSIGRTEYLFRGDRSRVAFTESNLRLATDINSPSVARSMVDVAQARGWRALRVSGHEDFKRLIWLEASVRGIKALGYEPSSPDLELLQREREARLVNRIEPAAVEEKASGRSGGGRNTVLAAVEALLLAQNVPERQRVAVMEAAAERLAELKSQGVVPRVRIYDVAAPSHAATMSAPETQRTLDRSPPAPLR